MVLPALAGIGGAVASITSFTSNKFIAWILTVVFLIGDGAISSAVGYQGVAGQLFSIVFSTLLGVEIFATSFNVLILLVLFSVIGVMLTMNGKG